MTEIEKAIEDHDELLAKAQEAEVELELRDLVEEEKYNLDIEEEIVKFLFLNKHEIHKILHEMYSPNVSFSED